ncbi:hypothetical protein D9619_011842 [Psilocybe cf. subviscida]|uniref:Uncharacterized protein n=1 Tax=Psilocybe cf. subviscida TaxID=2480587 RepID=A0A8H5EVV9_9AGAR|nr:hypothetical protein D9619_011842 [Psilocybe cf. subviscida]
MSASPNPEVTLLADSLYIATNQIMAPSGLFHWSMYITDSAGKATKYEWADLPPHTGTGKAEGLVITRVDPVSTYSQNFVITFAMTHVNGYIPPPAPFLEHLFANVFEEPYTLGYGSIQENRRNNLTCRTWAMTVYAKLVEAGYIGRTESRDDLEAFVKAKSIALEEKAAIGKLECTEIVEF